MGDKKVLQREQRSEKEKMTKHLEHKNLRIAYEK